MELQKSNVNIKEEYIGERRVPVGEYLKLKKNSLLLYIYLQKISTWNDGEKHRYIRECELNKTKMAKELKMTTRSVYDKLKRMEEIGLITYWYKKNGNKEDKYIILPQVGDYYTLVDVSLKFVKSILRRCDECLLRVFLFHKSYGRNGQEYYPTLQYIAESVGYSPTNLQRIIDCNNILEGFEIIKIRKEYVRVDGVTVEKNYYTYLKANKKQ